MPGPQAIPCQHDSRRGDCPWCRVASDGRYARLFSAPTDRTAPGHAAGDVAAGGGGVAASGATPALPCVHLGQPTGETVTCPTCPTAGGSRGVQLKTFACALHGACTVGKAAPGVACCRRCPDYQSAAPALPPADERRSFPVRDCLYHVYPLASGARIWRRCLSMLLARASLFTGKRVISCMTGPGLESPNEVWRMAKGHGFDVESLPNDPKLRETVTLLELLPDFATDDPGRALFVGHAKGVTRPDDDGVTCHPWSVLCHELTLDYWPLAESHLRRWPVTGPFKKVGRGFKGSRSAWHYSGGFYWLRSREFFALEPAAWQTTDRRWFGSESSVGVWFRPEEAGCLFGAGTQEALDLYRMDVLKEHLVRYALWRAEHEGMRTERMVAR